MGCERRYQVGDHWHNLRPDALAEYRVGEHRLRFWLEWDRGTMNGREPFRQVRFLRTLPCVA